MIKAKLWCSVIAILLIELSCGGVEAESPASASTLTVESALGALFMLMPGKGYRFSYSSRWERDDINIAVFLAPKRAPSDYADIVEHYTQLVKGIGKKVSYCRVMSESPKVDSSSCQAGPYDIFVFVPDVKEDIDRFFEQAKERSLSVRSSASEERIRQFINRDYESGHRCSFQFSTDPTTHELSFYVLVDGVPDSVATHTWADCLRIFAPSSFGVHPLVDSDAPNGLTPLPMLLPIFYSPGFRAGMSFDEARHALENVLDSSE